jgi:hypothetical protein
MYKASRYGLQANGVNPVLCLPGRKSVEFQLFDKSLMRERILLEVAPSLACRLRIPVDRETADRVLCIRSRELVKLKLLHKTFTFVPTASATRATVCGVAASSAPTPCSCQDRHLSWTCDACGDTSCGPALEPNCNVLHGPGRVR